MEHKRQVRSYTRRGGRVPERLTKAYEQCGDLYVLGGLERELFDVPKIDIDAAFGRTAPLVVEIGSGGGDQLVARAKERPDLNVLGVEVWQPGILQTVMKARNAEVTNLRIIYADVAESLAQILDGQAPEEIWTFFPDPWPKAKHHKRRLVTPEFAGFIVSLLPTGGIWRLATDWTEYAWEMRDAIAATPEFTNPHEGERCEDIDPADNGIRGGFAPRWEGRTLTRFEKRGMKEGRVIRDLTAVKNG